MRDLYAALDLDRSASAEQVRARLPALADPELRAAVEQVLLVPERRAGYDRVHLAVEQIAALRVSLGLDVKGFAQLRAYGLQAPTAEEQRRVAAAHAVTSVDPGDAGARPGRGPGARLMAWLRRIARSAR